MSKTGYKVVLSSLIPILDTLSFIFPAVRLYLTLNGEARKRKRKFNERVSTYWIK